jgi:hypothetical protein
MSSFMKLHSSMWIAIGLVMVLEGWGAACRLAVPANPATNAQGYAPTSTCKGCHDRIVEQHLKSSHEMSFTNPTFQAQYQRDLLPKAEKDPDLSKEARECIACHEPITYAMKGPLIVAFQSVNPGMNGVTCDVCHTMTGYRGAKPQNGNYIMAPNEIKLGPFKEESNWHHAYSELQTKSEICAVCHEAVNHHGFQIKSTFTEWKESAFARQGVECQDCHMNVDGFLTAGKPRYSSGKAANMTLGSAPNRARLYTHQFPGAHSKTQVEGAIELTIKATPVDASQPSVIAIDVTVDNSRTGHSMPSGSADLRLLWLEVTAHIGDRLVTLPASLAEPEPAANSGLYSVVGSENSDARLIGPEIPKGSRVYRAIFADSESQATLNSYDAVTKLFDNRLKAAEKREETYRFTIPETVKGDILINATLKYLPYSSTFSEHLGLPKPEAVIVAQREIRLGPEGR